MLNLSLENREIGHPSDDEVIVRVEAAPLNPTDIGLLFGPADLTLAQKGEREMTAPIPQALLAQSASRFNQLLPVGNEAAGVVIRAGANASDLLGKTVSMIGGGMYAQYRRIHRENCLILDEGVSSEEGAAAFINPLTALGMIETLRREGHQAMVHTAAASSLGQILLKLCLKENIDIVNIVRSETQIQQLRDLGAKYILNSNSATFEADLVDAIAATRATLCFDALSGPITGVILGCMEQALSRLTPGYHRYGTPVHKQIYIYGVLDSRPTLLPRVGMSWSVGGWLVFDFLEKTGIAAAQKLRERVNKELRSTFAIHYGAEISLSDVLNPDVVKRIAQRKTGDKYLIKPWKVPHSD